MAKYVTEYQLVHLEADFEKRRPQLNSMALTQFPFFSPPERVRLAEMAVSTCEELCRDALTEGRIRNRKVAWTMMKHCLYQAVRRVQAETTPPPLVYSEAQLSAEFTAQYNSLLRRGHAFLMSKPRTRRDDIITTALPLAWYYARQALAKGRIIDTASARDQLGISLHWALLHVLRGQTLENTATTQVDEDGAWRHGPRRDFFDKTSPHTQRPVDVEWISRDDQALEEIHHRIDSTEFMNTLTERQRQILTAFLQGRTSEEIGHIFGLAAKTIRNFRQEIAQVYIMHFGSDD